jgi:hypothetical protein
MTVRRSTPPSATGTGSHSSGAERVYVDARTRKEGIKRRLIEHAQQNAFVLRRGQDPHDGGACDCPGDDQVPVTSPSFTPTSFAIAADITGIDNAGHI